MRFLGKTYWYPTPDFGGREIGVAMIDGTTPTMFGVYWEDQERHAQHWLTGKRTALRECPSPECMQDLLDIWAAKRELKVANDPAATAEDGIAKGCANHFTKDAIITAPIDYMPPGGLLPNLAIASLTRVEERAQMAALLSVPGSLEEIELAIRQTVLVGRRAAVRQACLISAVRDRFFEGDRARWLGWVTEQFGFSSRHADRCLAIGRFADGVLKPSLMLPAGDGADQAPAAVGATYMLPPKTVQQVIDLDLDKLEMVASLPAEQLTRFVEAHPAAREEANKDFRKAVKRWKLPEDKRRKEEKKQADFEKARQQQAAVAATPEGKFDGAVVGMLKRIQGLEPLARGKIDVKTALQGAKVLLEATFCTLETDKAKLTKREWGMALECLEQTLVFARTIMDN